MNADYFIKKFEAIPDSCWLVRIMQDEQGRACALGHCGARYVEHELKHTEESLALVTLFHFSKVASPEWVNDGLRAWFFGKRLFFTQETPKGRILAALEYIKGLKP